MYNELKKNSLNIGLILGGILILIASFVYVMDYKLFLDIFLSLVISIIILFAGTYSAFKTKTINNESITFGNAFKSYFIAVAVGYLIYWIWMFIIYNIVDPQAAKDIDEQAMLMAKEMFQKLDISKEDINLIMEEMSKSSRFSLSNILQVYCFKLIGYSLVGLIISLIFFLLYPPKTKN